MIGLFFEEFFYKLYFLNKVYKIKKNKKGELFYFDKQLEVKKSSSNVNKFPVKCVKELIYHLED